MNEIDAIETGDVELVPVDQIRVMNPRARNPAKFKEIVHSIHDVGLKRPITVSRRPSANGEDAVYDLVCGQGRLEAFIELGEEAIPAIVRKATKEDRLVMSLVENLARRQPPTFDHEVQIVRLRDQGYSTSEIGKKVGLQPNYVGCILHLWDKGEERLIRGVERGRIPLSIAVELSHATDNDEQEILAELYETGRLVGKKLLAARRILQQRRDHGKKYVAGGSRHKPVATAETLVKDFEAEAARQKSFVRKARRCEGLLRIAVAALKQVLADENFVNLLRAEDLTTLPRLSGTDAPWAQDPRLQQETA